MVCCSEYASVASASGTTVRMAGDGSASGLAGRRPPTRRLEMSTSSRSARAWRGGARTLGWRASTEGGHVGRKEWGTWSLSYTPPDYEVDENGKIVDYVNDREPNNWGRWGDLDERGAVNFITPDK